MVSDDEILEAYELLASCEGIFCEPASAASFAGLRKLHAEGLDVACRRVVCIITGTGLKDPDTAVERFFPEITEIGADAKDMEEALQSISEAGEGID